MTATLMREAASSPASSPSPFPSLREIGATAERLKGRVLETPVWRWQTGAIARALDPSTEVWLKLELFQRTGSFKWRGALNALAAMDAPALQRGVVASSAGNHALTVAHAARTVGTHATLCMPRHANPARIAACRADGGTVMLTDTVHEAFALAQRLVVDEGRTLIHPYDGPRTAEGTGTIGLELLRQIPTLDAVVVPVGGGGLCAGIAAAVKQMQPGCKVYGVEPVGADAMTRSFELGAPFTLGSVRTVADSLGAPYALPYSYGVCRRFVDQMVRVGDDELCRAVYHLFNDMKLAVEPAAAASTAALLGPLKAKLSGKRVGLIVCGSNTDGATFAQTLARGTPGG